MPSSGLLHGVVEMTRDRTEMFIAHLPEGRRPGVLEVRPLRQMLSSVVEAGRAAWPGLSIAPELFLAYLAKRLPETGGLLEQLRVVHVGELYLACACAQRDERAVELFDAEYSDTIGFALGRLNLSEAEAQDVRQRLGTKLFVGDCNHLPDIAKYSGRGSLRSWVKTTVMRMALEQQKRAQREVPAGDQLLLSEEAAGLDPELSYLKHLYRDEFRDAFRQAVNALGTRERNLLRQQLLDGLGIDGIAAQYRVHRATAARWLATIRRKLAVATRDRMMARLDIPRAEYDSIMRLIDSRLEASIDWHLQSGDVPEAQ